MCRSSDHGRRPSISCSIVSWVYSAMVVSSESVVVGELPEAPECPRPVLRKRHRAEIHLGHGLDEVLGHQPLTRAGQPVRDRDCPRPALRADLLTPRRGGLLVGLQTIRGVVSLSTTP